MNLPGDLVGPGSLQRGVGADGVSCTLPQLAVLCPAPLMLCRTADFGVPRGHQDGDWGEGKKAARAHGRNQLKIRSGVCGGIVIDKKRAGD